MDEKKIAAAEALVARLEDHHLAYDVATSFSCGEIDPIVEFLEAWGSPTAARVWLDMHALGDDKGDEHYELGLKVSEQVDSVGYSPKEED